MVRNMQQTTKYSVLAILSLIFGFLFYPAGLILGIFALKEIKNNPSLKGKTLARIGIWAVPAIICLMFVLGIILGFIRSLLAPAI